MRYIDNGTGDPRKNALLPWLQTILTEGVVGVRWQSGFFEASVLGLFMPTLKRLAAHELDTIVLIGSNDGETKSAAARLLVDTLGLPRPNARLGVVRYADGFYHPKTIHVRHRDGREIAYVGSSNLTSRGINGLNVEAGIILDTDDGDPRELLTCIKDAAHEWFYSQPVGLFEVMNHEDVKRLEQRGILMVEQSSQRIGDESGGGPDPLPHRTHRHALPAIPHHDSAEREDPEDEPVQEPTLDGSVLIAELAGPGRWSQAAFPEWFIKNFFRVLPGTSDVLRLRPVTEADGIGAEESVSCGFKKGSKNWYYELGLAATIGAYPAQPPKPIGIFHSTGHQICRYTILMPDDESYPHVAEFLQANRDRLERPTNELPRTIVPAKELQDAWQDTWFFKN